MRSYEFTIIASGLDPEAPDFADRFFEAGCDDATISFQKGVILLEFGREARNLAHALVSAISDVQSAGARIERIEPDYLVSLSDIAKRSGMTRAAISNFAKGIRGEAFPVPIARVTTESPLWDWVHVSRWMMHRGNIPSADVVQAKMMRAMNQIATERSSEMPHASAIAAIMQEKLKKQRREQAA